MAPLHLAGEAINMGWFVPTICRAEFSSGKQMPDISDYRNNRTDHASNYV